MTYPLDRPVHQATLNDELSAALSVAVRTAQRPPYDSESGTAGTLVLIDATTGEESDALDGQTVADVLAAHTVPTRPDPQAEFDAGLASAAAKPTVEEKVDSLLAVLQGDGLPGKAAARGKPAG